MKTLPLVFIILIAVPDVSHAQDYGYYYYHYGGCNIWAMADCWFPMIQHLDDLETAIVPTYTNEELTPICNSYDQVQRCVQEFIHDCHPTVQNEFQSVNDSWHYICVEAKQEYLQHRECLDNEDLHEEGDEVCYDHLIDQLNRLRTSNEEYSYLLERQCHIVNNYLDCVENLILSFNCSQAAALWQRELDRRAMQPLLTDTGCILDNSTGKIIYVYRTVTVPGGTQAPSAQEGEHSAIPKGVLIGCTVVLAIIILAVGLLIAFKYFTNKKHHQQKPQSARYANQPAPQRNQWATPVGYGGGAIAFGVSNDPLPGKEGDKDNWPTENPPQYTVDAVDGMGLAPPSQPPPYTGYPQSHMNTHSHSTPNAPENSIADVE